MKYTLSQTFTFDAAHTLDRDEGSRRIHGHTYFAEVSFRGAINQDTGMLTDLGDLRNITEGIRDVLDHQLLDDVAGLGHPTIEGLCGFIAQRMVRYPAFASVKVWRVDGGSCLLELDE